MQASEGKSSYLDFRRFHYHFERYLVIVGLMVAVVIKMGQSAVMAWFKLQPKAFPRLASLTCTLQTLRRKAQFEAFCSLTPHHAQSLIEVSRFRVAFQDECYHEIKSCGNAQTIGWPLSRLDWWTWRLGTRSGNDLVSALNVASVFIHT